jgi:hypothetical protein
MFNTKGQNIVESTSNANKSLVPGVHLAHIYSGKILTAGNGKKALQLVLEGEHVDGFEGWNTEYNNPNSPKYKGASGIVGATAYTESFNDGDVTKNEILAKIVKIADELGLRKYIDMIGEAKNPKNIEEFVQHSIEILKDENAYWFLTGTEQEYNGKINTKLGLPKYKFISKNIDGLDTFDKNNKYHFKGLTRAESVNEFSVSTKKAATDDDLPF